MNNVRTSLKALLVITLGLVSAACASSAEPAEASASVTVDPAPISPLWTKNLSSRVMLRFGMQLSALEQIECLSLNGQSESITFPDGCTVQVTNSECRSGWSDVYDEYVCVCNRTATSGSGC